MKILVCMLSIASLVLTHGWDYNDFSDWPVSPEALVIPESPINIKSQHASKPQSFNITLADNFTANVLEALTVTFAGSFGQLSILDNAGLPVTLQSLNFHFHTISEHTVDGQHYPAELHIVFANATANGSPVVVAVFLDLEKETVNTTDNLEATFFSANVKPDELIYEIQHQESSIKMIATLRDYFASTDLHFYRYIGSLTVPACTPATFFVFERPLLISRDDLEYLRHKFLGEKFMHNGHNNNRPIQPLRGRTVGYFSPASFISVIPQPASN